MRIMPSIRSLLFALLMLAMSAASFAQVGIFITIAPPALPVYEQPLCPGEGYLWMPGYWAYGDDYDDYYWVPGTWVLAPEVGFLWTPGYWGWGGDRFIFYEGYWGPHVGFYGGINYGYGYFGEGYEGGRWDNGRFFYNRSVNNVNITIIHNVYNTTVINRTVNRVSFNGGNGGINRRPTPQEEAVAHEKHIPPVAAQTQHVQAARANPELRASVNQGKPPVAATPKPGAFKDRAVVPAKEAGAPYKPAANRAPSQQPANAPAAQQDKNAARPDRPAPKNQPESNRAEPNRPPTAQPTNRPDRPEANRPPTAQPNKQQEPNRNEPARSQTPPPSERSQPQRTPPAETKRPAQEQQHGQPGAQKPDEKQKQEEKKQQDKQPKKDEPPQ
jgi:WXXGXW repeat (2 copies)